MVKTITIGTCSCIVIVHVMHLQYDQYKCQIEVVHNSAHVLPTAIRMQGH